MQKIDIQQFYEDFRQEVLLEASREGAELPTSEAFASVMIEALTTANVLDDATVAPWRSRGIEVTGYSFTMDLDEIEDLVLLVSVYKQSLSLETTSTSEIDAAVNRVMGFLAKVRFDLPKIMEESTPAYDMVMEINDAFNRIRRVRIVVITDGLAIIRDRESLDWYAKSVLVDVWDIRRLYQIAISGKPQEPINIDFVEEFGDAIPCLPAPSDGVECQSHLAVIPGLILAEVYEKFGGRLLERNVRAFLQARGKVNSGIRRTIFDEPGRFLAYNNGISATASAVKLIAMTGGGTGISAIEDLQIVNGGQTTASIHHAFKRDRDRLNARVSELFVQAKITVVPAAQLDEVVPLISRYANSQNKVNEADFEANSPYHVAVESYSRRLWACKIGESRMTHWFYERARGQYADALSKELTPARKRDFKLQNPLQQKITKTDLAKFVNCWQQLPHIVSLGAEKNFRHFTLEMSRRPIERIDQREFHKLVALAILYRHTERIVTQRSFGGYRANIVAYTIALLSRSCDSKLDFEQIWSSQSISEELSQYIDQLCEPVREVLINAPGNGNITEWCKKRDCWSIVSEIDIAPPNSLTDSQSRRLDPQRDIGNEILNCLVEAGHPLDRSHLVDTLGIGSKEWNAAIRELLNAQLVSKIGSGLNALYVALEVN